MKTIDEIKKEVAKECAEEHFEVIFEAEISVIMYLYSEPYCYSITRFCFFNS